jgi:flagella basal body P-ring formation protein FlgA
MNEHPLDDEPFLQQVDRLLERGKPSEHPVLNSLAKTRPQMDADFQEGLEHMLMAQLQPQQTVKEKKAMQMAISRRPAQPLPVSFLTLAATLLVIAFAGKILWDFNQQRMLTPTPNVAATAAQTEDAIQIVIATRDIPSGTIITEDMVGLISLPLEDLREVRMGQPGHEFFTDAESVIGQTAAVDIFWFSPVEPMLLGEPIDRCSQLGVSCPEVPEGYYTINFPATSSTVQELETGNRVDVLAMADGQLQVIVQNVLLADIQAGTITLGAPSWQLGVLIWLSQTGEPYALRLYTGETREPVLTPVEYTFTSPEPLPDDYQFDLIVGLPASKGYLLTGLPASIDHIPYTQRDDLMQFWFKNLEMVSIENGTQVTIRLPRGDAANLDYLINLRASMSFVPDEDRATR